MYRSDWTDADLTATFCTDLFEDMTESSSTSAPQGAHEDSINGCPSSADADLPNFNMAFTPTTPISMGTFTTQSNYSSPGDTDAWVKQAQGRSRFCFCDDPSCLPETGHVRPQLVGDPHWTGVSPYATHSAAATPNVVSPSSSATTPRGQDDLAWLFGPGQSIYHATSSSEGASEGTMVAPELGTNISTVATYPMGWATNEVAWPIPAAPETSATAASGKRRRDDSHRDGAPVAMNNCEVPPQKRVRGGKANGILKAARSATRTRHKPVARIPKSRINSESKQAGRGAERLATPSSLGIRHQSLLGPSLKQGWAEEAPDGQLIWVEGSVEEVVQGIDSTVKKEQQREEEGYFPIPKDLKTGYQALLAATQAGWERGTVREIKCRLCPSMKFMKWAEFKRHCNCMETHPLKIYFCEHCGDYFAHSDSCQRHRENRPPECLRVTPEKAEAKRRGTQRKHDTFIWRLEGFLTTGEDIGKPFSKAIKDMYPDSSKKRIRGSKE